MFLRASIVVITLLALTACDNTTSRYADDYATKLSRNQLLLLPANVEANTLDVGGNKTREYNYEDHVEPILGEQLQKKLEAKGYRAVILHKKDLMIDKHYLDFAAFKEAFATAKTEAYKQGPLLKRELASKSDIRLNQRAMALGKKLNAPLLVYVDYSEIVRTSGGQAADFAAAVAIKLLTGADAGGSPDNVNVIVAIIDTEKDRVLWMNPGASAGGGMVASMVYTDEEQSLQHINFSLDHALRQLPNRDDLFKKE